MHKERGGEGLKKVVVVGGGISPDLRLFQDHT